MGISDKTRKILWARSGNRCAFCKLKLVMDKTDNDEEAIIGEECHIVAQSADGPRGESSWSEDKVHHYNNLILLCRVHHKLIDDQPNTFTQEILLQIKKQHELWVDKSLEPPTTYNTVANTIAIRVTSGQEIVRIISNTYLFDFGNDDLESEAETEMISDFIQELHDYGDIADAIDGGEIVRLGYRLSQRIKDLEEIGFHVYGSVYKRKVNIGGKPEEWPTSYIRVVRNNNPNIKTLDQVISDNQDKEMQ